MEKNFWHIPVIFPQMEKISEKFFETPALSVFPMVSYIIILIGKNPKYIGKISDYIQKPDPVAKNFPEKIFLPRPFRHKKCSPYKALFQIWPRPRYICTLILFLEIQKSGFFALGCQRICLF